MQRDDVSVVAPFCPYKGLQPYKEEDSDYFFGRKRDSEIIAANLCSTPLTVLHGASGVGKSSVLMAGVVPNLSKTAQNVIVLFRKWQAPDAVDVLKKQTLNSVLARLGAKQEAVNTLETSLWQLEQRMAVPSATTADERSTNSKKAHFALLRFRDFLRDEKSFDFKAIALDDLLFECRFVSDKPVYFIFDQFEEYFLYHPLATGKNSFDAELARAINRQDIYATFLIALREDGLSALDRLQGRIPNLLGNLLRLENLDQDGATSAIREPLKVFSQNYPEEEMRIEDSLVTAIIEQVTSQNLTQGSTSSLPIGGERPGRTRIETSFLQLVLTSLWEAEKEKDSHRMSLKTLEQLGGAVEIARAHVDKVMRRLSEANRDVAARIFRFLVTPSGTKIALTCNDLASLGELTDNNVEAVLKPLVEDRILRPVKPPPGQTSSTRYEIYHDVLAPVILGWRARHLEEEARRRLERAARKDFEFGKINQEMVLLSTADKEMDYRQRALQAYARAAALYKQATLPKGEADALNAIAQVYSSMGNREKAQEFFEAAKGIKFESTA